MRHIPPSRSDFMPVDITFRALFTNTRARLCSAVALCFFSFFFFCVRFRGPVVCVRRRRATIAERGSEACAWALWAVVWIPASLTDGWSLNLSFFLWLSCSVLPEGLPAILSAATTPPPPPPPPFADEDVSPCKQSRGKNMSLCPRGMHKTGVNVPLKRC